MFATNTKSPMILWLRQLLGAAFAPLDIGLINLWRVLRCIETVKIQIWMHFERILEHQTSMPGRGL